MCSVAVVLWSKTSVISDNVRHEALVARKANKLLPAMIDSIEADVLPMCCRWDSISCRPSTSPTGAMRTRRELPSRPM